MTNFNLLLLVLVLAISTEIMATPGRSRGRTVSYDELQLVFQWPISYCKTHRCDDIPVMFKVHGLWPNRNSQWVDCSKLNPCNNYQLQITPRLQKIMETYWPDLECRNYPESFWLYEYNKHGSCIKEFRSQMDYFETALHIAHDIGDVMRMPLSTGKTLERGQSYQAKDFEFVTKDGRITPGLRCSTANGKTQLQEIVFCTDSNKRLKNCTANMCRMIPMPRQPRPGMCRMIPMPRQPRPWMCRRIPMPWQPRSGPKWSARFIFP